MKELGAEIVAISADSVESHVAFEAKVGAFPFPLASDQGLLVANRYGVLDQDARRASRAVFVIAQDGAVKYRNTHYSPSNLADYQAIFNALGVTAD